MSRATIYGVAWQVCPFHPPARAGAIMGHSEADVDALIESGELRAVESAGKKLVTTDSIVEHLARARPWSPGHAKVRPPSRVRSMHVKAA
jgi:hypothetical protein